MRRIELRLEARAEFVEAIVGYEGAREGLGARFDAAVDRLLARIASAPQQFPEIEPGCRRALVHGFPYGVFFTATESHVIVLAIVHLHRAPETWQGRR
jgi:plasmid stabilization system protein ParE